MKPEFSLQIDKKSQILNSMKICSVRAELFHADRHDKDNSHFSQLCKRA